jgi:hypothetical protein
MRLETLARAWPLTAAALLTAASALMSLVACGHHSAACTPEEHTYSVTTAVSFNEPSKSSAEVPLTQGRLLASVVESSSVIACANGIAQQVSPGRALLSNVPVSIDAAGFTLRVHSTVYPEVGAPALSLQLLFDQNGNGHCDDGEPRGTAAIERVPRSHLRVALVSGPCAMAL